VLAALALAGTGAAPTTSWAKLHRPLHLPRLSPGSACPVSAVDSRIAWRRVRFPGSPGVGRGPVYPGLGATGGTLFATPDVQFGGPWAGGKVFWYVRSSYRGRVLIRGRRLDGPEGLGFNGNALPARELRIDRYDTVSWTPHPRGSRGVASTVRARASGCYGVQVDGATFSRVVIFSVQVS
jgi:hypothetical protein